MINEFRRSRRRKVSDTILVVDAMTDSVVGRIGNLSETGMLLMANGTLPEDALFQFRFTLPADDGGDAPIELGAHLLWQENAGVSGHAWSGFRFITVPENQMVRLRDWIDAPGGQFE
jgi:hypothetical protein